MNRILAATRYAVVVPAIASILGALLLMVQGSIEMVRVIIDANKNGKWDSGNYEKGILPENIYTFSEVTKVRANWEIDLKLTNKNK
jgi:hypothetical protein